LLFGPAVKQASAIFDDYWNSTAAVPVAPLARKKPERMRELAAQLESEAASVDAQPYFERLGQSQGMRAYLARELAPHWIESVQIVSDPPLKWKSDDRSGWLVEPLTAMLEGARQKALLISPYFVPGEEGSNGLKGLVAHGVSVGVVTNSLAANDVPAVHSGYARYRERLLRDGVSLHEMKARTQVDSSGVFGSSGASLHTKAYSVDDARGFIGSFNLDARSAYLNTEMGVMFDDADLAKAVRDEYLRLSGPELSYWMHLDKNGNPRWLDRAAKPPSMMSTEPDTGRWQRISASAISWLPVESQL